jgi:hypothetical protein
MKVAHKPNNHSKTKPEKKKQGILINTKHREDKQKQSRNIKRLVRKLRKMR